MANITQIERKQQQRKHQRKIDNLDGEKREREREGRARIFRSMKRNMFMAIINFVAYEYHFAVLQHQQFTKLEMNVSLKMSTCEQESSGFREYRIQKKI